MKTRTFGGKFRRAAWRHLPLLAAFLLTRSTDMFKSSNILANMSLCQYDNIFIYFYSFCKIIIIF